MIIGVNMTYDITFNENEITYLQKIIELALQNERIVKLTEIMNFTKRLTELLKNRRDDLY